MSPAAPSEPDPATEIPCRHCGEPIRKRRDKSGNQFEWVSYLGKVPGGDNEDVYSRFCRDIDAMTDRTSILRRRPRRQHGPIPLDNPQKLERWLES